MDVLLSPEKEPDVKKKILQEDFNIKMTRELESMGWSAEQAMTALKIPESERIQYVNGLKNKFILQLFYLQKNLGHGSQSGLDCMQEELWRFLYL